MSQLLYPQKLYLRNHKKGIFPEIWKKANVVSIHKKEDKTLIKNIVLLVHFLFLVKYLKG